MTLSRRRLIACTLAGPLASRPNSGRASVPEDVRIAEIGVPVDIADIPPGGWRHLELAGSPVFVRRLTPAQIAERPEGNQPGEAEWVIVSGICTHMGCRVAAGLGQYRGFACFCHGSLYDAYGRVRGGPARMDLPALPHRISDGKLVLFGLAAE